MRIWFLGYMGVRVTGSEHVPGRGPVLVCGNHRSVWDPILIGALMQRRASYIAKVELFRYPLLGPILRMVGAFPVRRHTVDRSALRRSLDVLKRQGALVLFPEGTRSRTGELGKGEPGAALLALRTGAVVVPVGICGRYGFRRGLQVRFGEPLRLRAPAQRLRGRELSDIVDSQVMREIARLAGAAGASVACAEGKGPAATAAASAGGACPRPGPPAGDQGAAAAGLGSHAGNGAPLTVTACCRVAGPGPAAGGGGCRASGADVTEPAGLGTPGPGATDATARTCAGPGFRG